MLLGAVNPLVLAGLLYVGAGSMAALLLAMRQVGSQAPATPRLARRERLTLAGAVLAGGVGAPILMLYGLRAIPAGTASLLLNFETVATTVIAAVAFGEAIGRRVWLAVALVTTAGCLLAWQPGEPWGFSLGAFSIVGACVFWGLDNNFSSAPCSACPGGSGHGWPWPGGLLHGAGSYLWRVSDRAAVHVPQLTRWTEREAAWRRPMPELSSVVVLSRQ